MGQSSRSKRVKANHARMRRLFGDPWQAKQILEVRRRLDAESAPSEESCSLADLNAAINPLRSMDCDSTVHDRFSFASHAKTFKASKTCKKFSLQKTTSTRRKPTAKNS